MKKPLWEPKPEYIEKTNLTRFSKKIQEKYSLDSTNYQTLHNWSTANPELFWEEAWKDCGIYSTKYWNKVLNISEFNTKPSKEVSDWFDGVRLNFAENLLLSGNDQSEAISYTGEDGFTSSLSFFELRRAVARCAFGLKNCGVRKFDRVAAVIPNSPEAIIGMLATTSIGAIWTSCSPDFGVNGIFDRLGQIAPKILITVNEYYYNGKKHNCINKVREIINRISSIKLIFIVSFTKNQFSLKENESRWESLLDNSASKIEFEQLPFDHPIYILYTSGTTGLPKSIVHCAGGTLLKHLTEQRYHSDLKPNDRLFYYTTCGWMMWNWLVSGLASGATLILYDGSPVFPDISRMWRLIEDNSITHFGTSPKFLSTVKKSAYSPKKCHKLSTLRIILSTGSPLTKDLYSWVYKDVASVALMSIAGGTDIIGCFMGGNPNLPVYSEEIQCKILGMDVHAYNSDGKSVVCEKGELVCRSPFPSTPIYFWNDSNGEKYKQAYFQKFSKVWTHGDFIEITKSGGVIVYGRSDTVLNPGGVRIGTSEIYRPVEEMEEILDSLVIAQPWREEIRIVLFVVLIEGLELESKLEEKIKATIRNENTPRHVPDIILAIPEVPRTISGKKVEKAVLQTIQGEKVKNKDALANPKSLDYFLNLRKTLYNW